MPFVFLLLFSILIFSLYPQSEVILKPIVIEKETSCKINLFERDDLSYLPSTSVEDFLNYFSSSDLKERGSFGLQRDLSIRGGTFYESKVFIEDIDVSDPQTGHFSLEIPFPAEAIQEIEPDFNAQQVNFKIRKPREKFFSYKSFWGRHALLGNSLSFGLPYKELKSAFYLEQVKSKASIQDTDFSLYKASFNSLYEDEEKEINFLYAFLKKDFGADGFYAAPKYMQEEEHITQNFSYLKYLVHLEGFDFSFTPYYRRHFDKFILDRHNPSFYTNYHTNYIYGISLCLQPLDSFFSYGLGFRAEEIDSTNLGNHQRKKAFFSLDFSPEEIESFLIKGGFSLDYYQPWGWLNQDSLELYYLLARDFKIGITFDNFYNVPSFTELFYSSPANKGDSNLKVQKTQNLELSLISQKEYYGLKVGLFLQEKSKAIDWVRDDESQPWQVKNADRVRVKGLELNLKVLFKGAFLKEMGFAYTYLHFDDKNSYNYSKYLFDYLRHKLIINLKAGSQRFFLSPVFLVDKPLSQRLKLITNFKIDYELNKSLSLFGEVLNLFNEEYLETAGVKSEGRLFRVGVEGKF